MKKVADSTDRELLCLQRELEEARTHLHNYSDENESLKEDALKLSALRADLESQLKLSEEKVQRLGEEGEARRDEIRILR